MQKPVAVILSGCGVQDGSEIHEAVLTLLALAKAGLPYQCLAPDRMQHQVSNHLTGQIVSESRNCLVEAARIARGQIQALAKANADDFAAAILPGGYGAAVNLSDFAEQGAACTVLPELQAFIQNLAKAHKPVGFICIAPVMISKIYGPGVQLTIGQDAATAAQINQMGGIHQNSEVTQWVIDPAHKVISTPAYMLAQSITEVASGIEGLVAALKSML